MKFETEITNVQDFSSSRNKILLTEGLVGFPGLKELEIFYKADQSPFLWLQSTGEIDIAFLVIQPYGLIPEYNVELSAHDAEILGIEHHADATLFNIVTIQDVPVQKVTVNLPGPIVVNKFTGQGKQVIIENYDDYSSRYTLFESAT